MARKNSMSTNALRFALAAMLFALSFAAEAQQPKKVALICYLAGSSASNATEFLKPIRERLRELHYSEGQNITIEYRAAEGKLERLPDLAAEFVRLNCDVILTTGSDAARAAKNATKTIPIVMGFGPDAVRLGIVTSLARPDGNITGMTDMGAELYGKRLELLKETVPKLSRVGILWSATDRGDEDNLKATEPVARFLKVGIQSLEVKGRDDLQGALRAATKGRANGLLVVANPLFAFHRQLIIEFAEKNRLPAMYSTVPWVNAGGLMFYGEDREAQSRRAAEIVDKILKGTKPADIPVERPKKFEFVINLQTAKQIGLTIPPDLLARATKIIR